MEWHQLTWNIFHKISLYYDDTYKNYYLTFFESFKKIIPCEMCRKHYINNINNNFYKSINEGNIFEWTIDLHNNINASNNKRLWTYNEAKEFYKNNDIDLKIFMYKYIKNFRYKENIDPLINMIKTIPYIYYEYNKKRNNNFFRKL